MNSTPIPLSTSLFFDFVEFLGRLDLLLIYPSYCLWDLLEKRCNIIRCLNKAQLTLNSSALRKALDQRFACTNVTSSYRDESPGLGR